MNLAQPSMNALTDLDAALCWLFAGSPMLDPVEIPLDDALGAVSGSSGSLSQGCPAVDAAALDGFAFASNDIAGASAYSPAILTAQPEWVEVGEPMPKGCDCILEAPCLDAAGPVIQVLCEAIPGQGVRRAGEDIARGRTFEPGRRLTPIDLLAARRSGKSTIAVRQPRLHIIDIGAADGNRSTTALVTDLARQAGGVTGNATTVARDADAVAQALAAASGDLVVAIGGTGNGRADATAEAIALCGSLFSHGLAIQPGRRTAIGRIGATPVVALPGLPDQALGAWLMVVQPVLDHMSGLAWRRSATGRLARKVASSIGFSEIVLLAFAGDVFQPLATGSFSLDQAAAADAWLAVPASSEGHAAGAVINAWPLREGA